MIEAQVESITPIYQGRIIQLNVERVRLPNGNTADLEIIHHPGGAAVVALDEQRRVCLLRQFRHAANGWLWEIPAGKIDNREPPLQTAQRELEEEGGMLAAHWESLGDYLSSPGVFTEVVHLYFATGLTSRTVQPEEHEVFEVHWLPIQQAVDMAYSGEIRDGKTLAALFKTAQKISSGRNRL